MPDPLPSSSGTLSLADREVLRYVLRHKRGPYPASVDRKVRDLMRREYVRWHAGFYIVTIMGQEALRNA